MKKRAFWLLSFAFVICAFWLQVAALKLTATQIRRINQAMDANVTQEIRPSLLAEANRLGHRADELVIIGRSLAVLSAVFLFTSHRRDEPAERVILVGSLVFYVIFQFARV